MEVTIKKINKIVFFMAIFPDKSERGTFSSGKPVNDFSDLKG